MDRNQKLESVLKNALLLFPVFKPNNKTIKHEPKVTSLQFITLMFIAKTPKKDGEPMNVISSFLGISKQQTTKLIDSLNDMGFIERCWNPTSRREILVKMTNKGDELLKQIQSERTNEFILRLDKLSDNEVDSLYYHISEAFDLFKKADY